MNLVNQLRDYVQAAKTGLWIHTYEPEDATREIAEYCSELQHRLAIWDNERGLNFPLENESNWESKNPQDVLKASRTFNRSVDDDDSAALLVVENFQWYLNTASDGGKKVVQTLQNVLQEGKTTRTFIVVLSPDTNVPDELSKQFKIIEHKLPERDEILEIMEGVAEEDELPKTEEDKEFIAAASAGFTRGGIEDAFALCVARYRRECDTMVELHGEDWIKQKLPKKDCETLLKKYFIDEKRLRFLQKDAGAIDPAVIIDEKASELKKIPGVRLLRSNLWFKDLGGMQPMKDFCLKALNPRPGSKSRASGIGVVGVPGSGKTAFCQALGNETGRPVLHVELGQLKSKNVGESSANMARMLQIADHMAPCILFLDEIEKMMASMLSSGSPVGGDMFQQFLTWLSEHTSDVFVICTANQIEKIMETNPEFFRSERLDAVFFVDLPSDENKEIIWGIHKKGFDMEDQENPSDDLWTGAEIKGCCKTADLLGISLEEASELIVPVAVNAAERIDWVRNWATSKVLSADFPGIYSADRHAPAVNKGQRRRISKARATAKV